MYIPVWCVCVCVCVQESQKIAEQKQEEKRALEREHKKARRQWQSEGKKPFFLKKCGSWHVSFEHLIK